MEMYMRTHEKVEAFKSFLRWTAILALCAWAVWFVWALARVL